jgi:AcrR family transcriptional regulator
VPRHRSAAEVDAFRDQLCSAAARRFAESGFAGVTLRALSAELGVSAMTPYRYFRNKEEIFAAVRTQAFQRFGVAIERAARGIADPIERIRAVGRAYVRFARREPQTYRIMFQLDPPLPSARYDPLQQHELSRGWHVLHAAVSEGIARGQLRGDAVLLAHKAWIPLHGLVTLMLARKLRLGAHASQLVEPLLEDFLQSNRARPNGPSGGGSP